ARRVEQSQSSRLASDAQSGRSRSTSGDPIHRPDGRRIPLDWNGANSGLWRPTIHFLSRTKRRRRSLARCPLDLSIRTMATRLSRRTATAKKSLGGIMPGQDRFIVKDEPFSKRGPLRTMPITIGGVPKTKLLEQVKAVRYVSPYAERIMRHENFTTLEKPESALLIVMTPKD